MVVTMKNNAGEVVDGRMISSMVISGVVASKTGH